MQKKRRELRDVDVQFVSLVRRGANGEKFAIYKSADYDTKGKPPASPEQAKEEAAVKPKDDAKSLVAEVQKELEAIRTLRKEIEAQTASPGAGDEEEVDILESIQADTPTSKVVEAFQSTVQGMEETYSGMEEGSDEKKAVKDLLASIHSTLKDLLTKFPAEFRKRRMKKPTGAPAATAKIVPSQADGHRATAGAGDHRDARDVGKIEDAFNVDEATRTELIQALKSVQAMQTELRALRADLEKVKRSAKGSALVDPDSRPTNGGGSPTGGDRDLWPSNMAKENEEALKKMGRLSDPAN